MIAITAPRTLCLGLLALAGGCQVPAGDTGTVSQPVAWGTVSLENEDPAVMMLYRAAGGYYCTGTLISPRVMLTARHCVLDENNAELEPSAIAVYRGVQPNPETEQGIPVLDYRYHIEADIAVIQLGATLDIPPMPLFPGRLEDHIGAPVVLVGYGLESDGFLSGPVGLGTKRWGRSKIDALMNALEVPYNNIPAGEVLVVGREGATTCGGDSGGPTILEVGAKEYVAGVVAFGYSPCQNFIAGHVRVDVYRAWIEQYGAELQGPAAPPPATSGNTNDGASPAPGTSSSPGTDPDDDETSAEEPAAAAGCAVAQGSRSGGWLLPCLIGLVAATVTRRRRA